MLPLHCKKIMIIGCAGSGKTTLAFTLHEKLHLPIIHLDQHYWKQNWQRSSLDEFTQKHDQLCLENSWIMEGSYMKLLESRAAQADMIIFLDIPRYICLWRVIKRAIFNLGKTIPGNPEDCPQELFNFKFLQFLHWIWDFNRRYKQTTLDLLNKWKDNKKVYIFKTQKEADQFLRNLSYN